MTEAGSSTSSSSSGGDNRHQSLSLELQPMEISKRYNSVPVRDNCALFAPIHLFFGLRYPMALLKFLPYRQLLPWQRILGQN